MNAFRQLLRAAGSKPPIGTWISSASPIVAEAIGHAGFDWGVVDMEHAPLDMMSLVHVLQALGGTKMTSIVRVPWNDAVVVKRVLDAGATTLLFPFVQNAAEAARAVAATRYPPAGQRGMSGMTRASGFGTVPNYLKTADAGMGVIVQLETPQALAQLEAIAARRGRGRGLRRPGRPVGQHGPRRPVHAPGGDAGDGRRGAALQGAGQARSAPSAATPTW